MAVEVRVVCEQDGCNEAAHVADDNNFDFACTVDALVHQDSFHFYVDTGWMTAPKGWSLDSEDKMRCPKHEKGNDETSQ